MMPLNLRENPESNPNFRSELELNVTEEQIKNCSSYNVDETTLRSNDLQFPNTVQLVLKDPYSYYPVARLIVSPETGRIYLRTTTGNDAKSTAERIKNLEKKITGRG